MKEMMSTLDNMNYLIPVSDIKFEFGAYKYILIIGQSKSPRYSVVQRAVLSQPHNTIEVDNHSYLIIGFNEEPHEIKMLHFLLVSIRGFRNSYLFINGARVYIMHVISMLECYLNAKECRDYRANCWKYSRDRITDDRRTLAEKKHNIVEYLEINIPCKWTDNFKDSSVPEQITMTDAYQAHVLQGVYKHCPFFKIDDFKYQIIADEVYE